MGMAFTPKVTRKYSWGIGSPKVSADVVGAVMERLESEQGKVTRSNFLEVSRPEESATHGLFEWDNDIAAEKFRLVQSGKYIQNLRVTIICDDPAEVVPQTISVRKAEPSGKELASEESKTISTRAFVSVADTRSSSGIYVNTEKAFTDEELRKRVLAHALEELEAFRVKYAVYSELNEVFEAIDRLKETSE